MNSGKLMELIRLLRTDSDFGQLELLVRNRFLSGIQEGNTETVCYESIGDPSWLSIYSGSKTGSRWKPSREISPEETYPLPRGWKWVRLNDLAIFINGLAFKPTDWSDAGRKIIRIQNLNNEMAPFNFTDKEFDPDYLVTNGDILVSWSATLEAFVWNREDAWVNQHIFRVLPNLNAVKKEYLYLLLKEAVRDLSESSHKHGLTMKHINRGPFLNHLVPLPPLEEQSRIFSKFEELRREISVSRSLRTATSRSAFEVTNALLSNLLTSLLDNDSPTSEKYVGDLISHVAEQAAESASTSYLTTVFFRQIQKIVLAALPKNSSDWKTGNVGDFLALNYGKGLPKLARRATGTTAVYGSNGIVGFHDEALVDKRCVVVGRKGSIGALQIANEPSWVTDVAYYVVETADVSFEFLPLLLGTLDMESLGRGVKPGLNRNEVYSLPVSIPPIHVQEKTTAVVAAIEKTVIELSAQVEVLNVIRTRVIHSGINELRMSSPSAASGSDSRIGAH